MAITDELLDMLRAALTRVDAAVAAEDPEATLKAAMDAAGYALRLDDHLSRGMPLPAAWRAAT